MMDVVFYLMAKKETRSLSLSSKVNPAVRSVRLFSVPSFLILCNEAGDHLKDFCSKGRILLTLA